MGLLHPDVSGPHAEMKYTLLLISVGGRSIWAQQRREVALRKAGQK
jgi:hypothetical protein